MPKRKGKKDRRKREEEERKKGNERRKQRINRRKAQDPWAARSGLGLESQD